MSALGRERIGNVVIAAIGGATPQAVSAAGVGNRRQWLEARFRRFVAELEPRRGQRSSGILKHARKRAAGFSTRARARLLLLPEGRASGTRGRPSYRDPAELARLLMLPAEGNVAGESLADVVERWVVFQLARLREAVRGKVGKTYWWWMRHVLDREWLPRWARKVVGVRPRHFREKLQGHILSRRWMFPSVWECNRREARNQYDGESLAFYEGWDNLSRQRRRRPAPLRSYLYQF